MLCVFRKVPGHPFELSSSELVAEIVASAFEEETLPRKLLDIMRLCTDEENELDSLEEKDLGMLRPNTLEVVAERTIFLGAEVDAGRNAGAASPIEVEIAAG